MIRSESTPKIIPKFIGFHDLMNFRVREILLVSSLYDAFVLEEDGRLAERIFSEYVDLNLHYVPRITKVSTAEEALQALQRESFDMVITMTRLADMNPVEFGQKVKELDASKPVVLLSYDPLDPLLLKRIRFGHNIDKVFYWFGESKILLAIIKYVEDLKNAADDAIQGVQVILLVEDSPKYVSLYLPRIYTEVMVQTRNLIADGVNPLHRLLRMRARPKILVAETFEEAIEIVHTYQHTLLGIICDLKFPHKGKLDETAGFKLAKIAKTEIPDLPILIQSAEEKWQHETHKHYATFINKNSPNLLLEMRAFILHHFGFGDFIFRSENGEEIGRAKNLNEFAARILEIPASSLEFHAMRNHISIWLRARTEFALADEIRPVKVSDFPDIEGLRQYIHTSIHNLMVDIQQGVIKDFTSSEFYTDSTFIRLGTGSLGGKGRGIAFLNAALENHSIIKKFQDVDIKTPQTFVIGTEVFEEFMETNQLQEFAISTNNEKRLEKRFLEAALPDQIVKNLSTLLERIHFPLAIRSSSLLEDSQLLPFAGLYKTFMLPNSHPDINTRLQQLMDAIRLIYASVFYRQPKEYVQNTDYRIEEEKMAVIIQQCIGNQHQNLYYPAVSGVAQSYNYYPLDPMESDEGIVHLALGLGKIIMDGERIYRFSPQHPDINLPYGSAQEFSENSQTEFFAIDMRNQTLNINANENFSMKKLALERAERDGTLYFVGSTYSREDQVIQDTLSIEGPRVITFANILKYKIFPLPEILNELLLLGQKALGTHVEVEFAVNLYRDPDTKPEFYILQIRPLVTGGEGLDVSIIPDDIPDSVCFTSHAIGNGNIENIQDIIYLDPEHFDLAQSQHIAQEVEQMNQAFIEQDKHFILIGFGRWGTADPWLGIPVDWYQVSRAKVLIESHFNNLKIEPSLGSHFFHNLISLRLGYFYIKGRPHKDFINWKWLKNQKPIRKTRFLRHLHFQESLSIKIEGKSGQGIIYKPGVVPKISEEY